jgi:alanine dehydrogenase
MLHLSREDVRELITHEEVVRMVEEGMRRESDLSACSVPRIDVPLGPVHPTGLNVVPGRSGMSIWIGGSHDRGGTIRALTAGGGIALYIDEMGSPAAILDFTLVQQYRTGAAAAIGTKYLARPEARTFALLGSGWFAEATLAAHAVTFEMDEVRIFSPNQVHREQFALEMHEQFRVNMRPTKSALDAVDGADVILVCTGMNRRDHPPALLGEWLRPGVHVTSNGGANELETSVYARAARVVVDDRAEIMHQILDIQRAVAEGILTWDGVVELPQLVAHSLPGRQSPDEITIARNRGNGVQDLFPTVELYRRAIERGVGTELGALTRPLRAP